jgi:hypothetical protein
VVSVEGVVDALDDGCVLLALVSLDELIEEPEVAAEG